MSCHPLPPPAREVSPPGKSSLTACSPPLPPSFAETAASLACIETMLSSLPDTNMVRAELKNVQVCLTAVRWPRETLPGKLPIPVLQIPTN